MEVSKGSVYLLEKKKKKMQRYQRKKVKIGLFLKDYLTRAGEVKLTFDHINEIKQYLGIKRLLYLLRVYKKLAGERTDKTQKKKKVFDPFENNQAIPGNHIIICKKILDIIFK